MKISELIAELEAIRAKHGEVETYQYWDEYGIYLPLDVVRRSSLWRIRDGHTAGELSDCRSDGELAVKVAALLG